MFECSAISIAPHMEKTNLYSQWGMKMDFKLVRGQVLKTYHRTWPPRLEYATLCYTSYNHIIAKCYSLMHNYATAFNVSTVIYMILYSTARWCFRIKYQNWSTIRNMIFDASHSLCMPILMTSMQDLTCSGALGFFHFR